MASQKDNLEVSCESCKKSLTQSTILRHIGNTPTCKEYYGERFTEMKREKTRNKVYKHRQNLSIKERKKSLKKMRKIYSQNVEKKEKNRQNYLEKRQEIKIKNDKESKDYLLFKKEKNEKEIDELSDKGEDLNILDKSTNKLQASVMIVIKLVQIK